MSSPTRSFIPGGIDRFKHDVIYMRLHRMKFRTEEYGSMAKIHLNEGNKTLVYSDNNDYQLMTLCSLVAKDASKYIKAKKLSPDDQLYSPIVDFNLSKIKQNIPGYAYTIDMKACYWNRALKKGVISQKTYQRGVDNKENRLIALGALNKTIQVREYLPEKVGAVKSMQKGPFSLAWNDIIKDINDIYDKCLDVIGLDNYFMWLTDCVYIRHTAIKPAYDFFRAHDIEISMSLIQFTSMSGNRLMYDIMSSPDDKQGSILLPVEKPVDNYVEKY